MSFSRDEPPPRNGDVVELRIPRSPAYVSVARRTVECVAQRLAFERAEIDDVKLAVGEACNNAIRHGSDDSDKAPVTIRCTVDSGGLAIEIRNYHPVGTPPPTTDPAPDFSKEGGLGFRMMRQLVDDVEFVWGEDFALTRLTKTIRKPSQRK